MIDVFIILFLLTCILKLKAKYKGVEIMSKKDNVKLKLEVISNVNLNEENKITFPDIPELTAEEEELKEKLLKIEQKVNSIYNVIENINNESCTIYSDDLVMTETIELLSTIAVNRTLSEYLNILDTTTDSDTL